MKGKRVPAEQIIAVFKGAAGGAKNPGDRRTAWGGGGNPGPLVAPPPGRNLGGRTLHAQGLRPRVAGQPGEWRGGAPAERDRGRHEAGHRDVPTAEDER